MALEYRRRARQEEESTEQVVFMDTEQVVLAGMSEAIYEQLDALLAVPFEASLDDADTDEAAKALTRTALQDSRRVWRQLAYAVAAGVVTHLKSNLEIVGAGTTTTATLKVGGSTARTGGHSHDGGDLSVSLSGIEFR
jgi:hypothetical protein